MIILISIYSKMNSTPPEAAKLVLTPVNPIELYLRGFKITYEEIGPNSVKDEKRELLDEILKKGENVVIDYIFKSKNFKMKSRPHIEFLSLYHPLLMLEEELL